MLMVGFILGFTLGLLVGLLMIGKCEASNTDREKVLNYIRKHGSITAEQAQGIDVNHVRSVICKLKRKGISVHNANPIGQKARYEFK